MATVQSGFPDLDAALTVSRVEVVSNVEIETIKGALRWLFTELQEKRAPASADGMAVTPEQLDELRKSSQEQKALLTAVQEQQAKLDIRATEAEHGLHILKQLPETVQKVEAGQQAAAGFGEQLPKLQEQLKALSDGQARLTLDIAALKGNPSSASTSAAAVGPAQAGQQMPSNGPAAMTDATAAASGAAAAQGPSAPDTASSRAGAAVSAPDIRAAGSSPAADAGRFGQRLDALTDEVAQLRSAMAAQGGHSGGNQSSASLSTAGTAASPSPQPAAAAAPSSSQGGGAADAAAQQKPGANRGANSGSSNGATNGVNSAANTGANIGAGNRATSAANNAADNSANTRGSNGASNGASLISEEQNRINQDAEDRLAGLSDAVQAVRDQLAAQNSSLGQLRAAEGEVRRLVGDKAGLADVQALLQAHSPPTLVPVPQGGSAEAGMAGAINGLGAKVGGLEGLLALTQQRIADKADAHELDALRAALNKLRAAVGDEAVPSVLLGTAAGPDAADVVPADSDSSPAQSLPASGSSAQAVKTAAAVPSSLNARLATLELSMSAANKMTPVTRRTTTMAGSAFPASALAAADGSSSSADSDIAQRVASLEAQLSQLRLPVSGITSRRSLAHDSQSPAGSYSAQSMQSDSAQLSDRLSQLQQQIEALTTGKANKADLEAMQLHAAVFGSGSGQTDSGSGGGGSDSGSGNGGGSSGDGSGASSGSTSGGGGSSGNGDSGVSRGTREGAGGMAGLLEAVQQMVAGKADREEVQALRRTLGDKVNLADHQAAFNNLESSMLALQAAPASGRSTAGLLGAAPAPASPRGGAAGVGVGSKGETGFAPVRPGRRGTALHDENEVPGGALARLRDEVQQLKGVVEVLTSATHLMAIPTPNPSGQGPDAPGQRMTGEVGVTELVQGGASTGNTSATNATGGTLPALPTAATAAAAAAAAAIAGLGATAPVEGGAPGKPGASHPLTGLSRQKQGTGKDGTSGAGSEAGAGAGVGSGSGAAQHGPIAPAPTPRPDSSSPEGWSQQASGMGGEGPGEGPLQELVSSMKAGQLGHKMNDTDILNQLVQRLAALEKLVKKLNLQPQGSGHVAGAVAGKGPDDRLLRRLGSDLALVKRRLDELAPRDPGALLMMREGDHAMLASKPIQGYRCMACDRPLAKLDPDMGGFVPSPHMPVSVSLEPSKNNGVVLANKDGAGQGRSGAARKGPPAAQQSKTAVPQTGEEAGGPQKWLKDAPAQALPREDVGPHLPPGGWRAGTSQGTRAQTTKGSTGKAPGTRPMADNDEVGAWDTQASVALPNIHAKPQI